MPDYHLYCIGPDGHVRKRHSIVVPDDIDALDRAKELCETDDIEIWSGTRFIARVAPEGNASPAATLERSKM